MKENSTIKWATRIFISFSALSLLSVSIMAFVNPQSVMDLVNVKLSSTDAFSSIRGVYGGVGFTLFISLVYLMVKDPDKGLMFLILLWGFYALSRGITMVKEGPLGDFGSTWMVTESVLFTIATVLFIFRNRLATR